MNDKAPVFSAADSFAYGFGQKRSRLRWIVAGILGTIIFTIIYYKYLQNSAASIVLRDVVSGILENIRTGSFRGIFYTAFFGGLFFLYLPTDVMFLGFLKSGHGALPVSGLYLAGATLSCWINYAVGTRAASFARFAVTPRKFYRIKGLLNQYGGLLIFVFNALPLPAEALVAVLGVFRYNRLRFIIFFLAGKMVLYTGLSIIYFAAKFWGPHP